MINILSSGMTELMKETREQTNLQFSYFPAKSLWVPFWKFKRKTRNGTSYKGEIKRNGLWGKKKKSISHLFIRPFSYWNWNTVFLLMRWRSVKANSLIEFATGVGFSFISCFISFYHISRRDLRFRCIIPVPRAIGGRWIIKRDLPHQWIIKQGLVCYVQFRKGLAA